MITNISFDLWLTLIRSHPQFKRQRAEMIADCFNTKQRLCEEIDVYIRSQDKIFDRYNESTGLKISAIRMYERILKYTLDDQDHSLMDHELHELSEQVRKKSDALFLTYLPLLMDDGIPDLLNTLRNRGIVCNIASNTGYMEANVLQQAFDLMGIATYFDFCVFSDRIGHSKPSSAFFAEVHRLAKVDKSQILHVGDNIKTDFNGATQFGCKALHLQHPDDLFQLPKILQNTK